MDIRESVRFQKTSDHHGYRLNVDNQLSFSPADILTTEKASDDLIQSENLEKDLFWKPI